MSLYATSDPLLSLNSFPYIYEIDYGKIDPESEDVRKYARLNAMVLRFVIESVFSGIGEVSSARFCWRVRIEDRTFDKSRDYTFDFGNTPYEDARKVSNNSKDEKRRFYRRTRLYDQKEGAITVTVFIHGTSEGEKQKVFDDGPAIKILGVYSKKILPICFDEHYFYIRPPLKG